MTKQFLNSSKWLLLFIWMLSFPLSSYASNIYSLTLTQRQLCDLELLFNGGFAPLDSFMDHETYDRVVHEMRLPDGTLWPMPVVLDISKKCFQEIQNVSTIALKDPQGFTLALVEVSEIWKPEKEIEAKKVYGTTSLAHPGVNYLFHQVGDYYVAGSLKKVLMPKHCDFTALRKTPEELKAYFKSKGITKVVAFQTRNPMHRAHLELTTRATQQIDAHLLLHPAVGLTKPGDVDYFTRVKCYQKLLNYYPQDTVTLSLLPIAMRMAGPVEALWHAIIRKNYGCTHFIVGRDHAGPGKDEQGKDFYDPYAAQNLVRSYAAEIGIEVAAFKEMVYVKEDETYQPFDEVDPNKTILNISGTRLRKMLREGSDIPDWFSLPEIIAELKKVYPPRNQQGFTIFFTGLSGSGKSTTANALAIKLMEIQDRAVTVLDGDLVRHHLSSELSFSKAHRSVNVRRVGFVANEITKNHGVAVCALIAPYEADRLYNRNMISQNGSYIEVYVSTPLEECEKRDCKGLYELAREGVIKEFTGISDPYEEPKQPEIVIDTKNDDLEEAVERIIDYLRQEKYLNL